MEASKKRRGRPRKKEDSLEPWQFGRAAVVTAAYDEARERGEKHSAAIRYAVDTVKQRSSEISISETEVKRTLAKFRPRDSRIVLRFEPSNLTAEEVENWQKIREAIASLPEHLDLSMPPLPNCETFRTFKILFAERPNFPRHNRKDPK